MGRISAVDALRERTAEAVRGLFSHVEAVPLESTMDHPGDPGLFGPGSVTWRVQRHPAVFVAAARALAVQACHPEVLAGVADHSSYAEDPLGRLSRTAYFVTMAAFGARPEVEEAVAMVRRAHRRVSGTSPRGVPYSAAQPELAAWVHNAFVDSYLTAFQRFGPGLSASEADRYVNEQRAVGELLGASPLPDTAADLTAYIRDHPDIDWSPQLPGVLEFLRTPPLSRPVLVGYRVLFEAALTSVPSRLLEILALTPRRGAAAAGRALVRTLTWALGESPAYFAARARAEAEAPDGDGSSR